jgi:hypothetical protein
MMLLYVVNGGDRDGSHSETNLTRPSPSESHSSDMRLFFIDIGLCTCGGGIKGRKESWEEGIRVTADHLPDWCWMKLTD